MSKKKKKIDLLSKYWVVGRGPSTGTRVLGVGGKHGGTTRLLSIVAIPEVIVFHLKRFVFAPRSYNPPSPFLTSLSYKHPSPFSTPLPLPPPRSTLQVPPTSVTKSLPSTLPPRSVL